MQKLSESWKLFDDLIFSVLASIYEYYNALVGWKSFISPKNEQMPNDQLLPEMSGSITILYIGLMDWALNT